MNVYAGVDKTSLILTIIFSFFGLVAAIISYVIFITWTCCIDGTLLAKIKQKFSRGADDYINIDDSTPGPILPNPAPVIIVAIAQDNTPGPTFRNTPAPVKAISRLQILGKVLLILANAVYLGLVGLDQPGLDSETSMDILGANTSTDRSLAGKTLANLVTFISFVHEIIAIVTVPVYGGCLWTCWWRNRLQGEGSFGRFLEFLRLADLEYTFFFAPFSNVNLFYLGKGWYVVLIYRLAFYSITFAAGVIAGVRSVFTILYCCILCECGCNSDTVELHNFKRLFLKIGIKMIPIALKLMTCSSALSTYLLLVTLVESFNFRVAYFSLTLLRGVTAIFSLSSTAIFLHILHGSCASTLTIANINLMLRHSTTISS